MQHFSALDSASVDRFFEIAPLPFDRISTREVLGVALGATLYTPGTRTDLAEVVRRRAGEGVMSMVLCLEDSIPDDRVEQAGANVIQALHQLSETMTNDDPPLIFIRIRTPEHLAEIASGLGDAARILTGFVLPKFNGDNANRYLRALKPTRRLSPAPLYAMPVMEDRQIIHARTRQKALSRVERVLAANREQILALRIGATDFMGAYGLRRNPDHTIYDVRVIADVVGDIVNRMGQAGNGYVIAGPVWEFFTGGERILKPALRISLFEEHNAADLRRLLVSADMDGLIREADLDKTNGLQGKTVIHPSHVPVVNSLQVVTHEEYADALSLLSGEGGASASQYRNKMNEAKPHNAWAERTMLRARIYGVLRPEMSFIEVLAASVLG